MNGDVSSYSVVTLIVCMCIDLEANECNDTIWQTKDDACKIRKCSMNWQVCVFGNLCICYGVDEGV